jgi:hypothetical protein
MRRPAAPVLEQAPRGSARMFGQAEAQLPRPVATAACPGDLDHRCGRWHAAVTARPRPVDELARSASKTFTVSTCSVSANLIPASRWSPDVSRHQTPRRHSVAASAYAVTMMIRISWRGRSGTSWLTPTGSRAMALFGDVSLAVAGQAAQLESGTVPAAT